MKKVLKAIWNEFVFLMTGKGKAANELIEADAIDYSGQGRDEYGHHIIETDQSNTKHERDPRGRQLDDLSGQTIGIYNVLELDHMKHVGSKKSTLSYYKCQCRVCGRVFVRTRGTLMTVQGNYHQGKCKK
jgi:hypothetical protein